MTSLMVSCSEMIVRLILFCAIAAAYNLDVDYPIIHSDPEKTESGNATNSYFGYCVVLIPLYYHSESQILIGAPQGSTTGIVYECAVFGKCSLGERISPLSPIRLRYVPNQFTIPEFGMTATLPKVGGWFGASIDSYHPYLQKICAPRTRLNIYLLSGNQFIDTMHGMCYFSCKGQDNSRRLIMETEIVTNYKFSSMFWYNPMHGFSLHVSPESMLTEKSNCSGMNETVIHELLKNTSTILGNPTNEMVGSVTLNGAVRRPSFLFSKENELTLFGYAVSSGFYFGKDKVLFASSAPAWQYVGQVAIFNSSKTLHYVKGEEPGEFFGASLTSGDLNNDSFDDLVVGSPHWGNDHGKVYIFLGSSTGFMNYIITIKGEVADGHFGYSMTSGDFDGDGYADLVIGAPWEGSGVIYIYNGYANLEEQNTLKPSQRIEASKISRTLQGFGFSVSKPVDIDGNGFVDLAVGAYKSGDTVILRSRPVEKLAYVFFASPKGQLSRNISMLNITFCLKNIQRPNSPGSSANNVRIDYTFKITVDEKLKRFTDSAVHWHFPISSENKTSEFRYNYTRSKKLMTATNSNWNGCINSPFYLLSFVQNFGDPVDVSISYWFRSFPGANSRNDVFCKMCPIKYQGQEEKPVMLTIPFKLVCRNNKSCESDISTMTLLHGVVNNVWVIGSGDISLETLLQIHGEPAYLVSIIYSVPKTIHLRSLPPMCQEEMSESRLRVVCDIGNALFYTGAQKVVKLDLDMKYYQLHIPTASDKQSFAIEVIVQSHNTNPGIKNTTFVVYLESNVTTSIEGKTNEDRFYLMTDEEKKANYSFQHTYNILKYGSTAIGEGKVTIHVPTAVGNVDSFILMLKPKLYVSRKFYDCSTIDIPLVTSNSVVKPDSIYNELDIFKSRREKNMNFTIDRRKRDDHNSTDYASSTKSSILGDFSKANDTFLREQTSIYVNCSTPGITCGKVICDITKIQSADDVGKILLSLFINIDKLRGVLEVGKSLRFSTNAEVNVTRPLRNCTQVDIMTTFHSIPQTEAAGLLKVWIVLISLVIGLCILAVGVYILKNRGFFKRYRKNELGILVVSEQEEEEESEEEKYDGRNKEGHEFREEF